ncbi:MAG: hypothetical protein RLY14_2324 [Planctomycetota bacterium]|jgi:hypothetical protein
MPEETFISKVDKAQVDEPEPSALDFFCLVRFRFLMFATEVKSQEIVGIERASMISSSVMP